MFEITLPSFFLIKFRLYILHPLTLVSSVASICAGVLFSSKFRIVPTEASFFNSVESLKKDHFSSALLRLVFENEIPELLF